MNTESESYESMAALNDAPSTLLNSRVEIPDHVVYRGFVAETVVLNLQTGQYHGIDAIGGRMIDALEKRGTVMEAAVLLSATVDVPVEQLARDIATFCIGLAERGLIAITPSA